MIMFFSDLTTSRVTRPSEEHCRCLIWAKRWPSRRPPGAPPGRSSGSRCSGTGCPRAPAAPRPRWGRGFSIQQRLGRDQHARRAEAALDAALLEERLLQRVQLSPSAKPSIVVTSWPSAWSARYEQELTGLPSISTMQAPHSESSQPSFGPVRPISVRSTDSSDRLGSTSTSYGDAVGHDGCRVFHGAPSLGGAVKRRASGNRNGRTMSAGDRGGDRRGG